MHKKVQRYSSGYNMIKKVIDLIKKLLLYERTPHKLAYASCVGIFIGFSPLIGFHWLLTLICAWAFQLNIGVIYAASHVINNPFTMVPIYLAGYATGTKMMQWLGFDLISHNPWWMNWLNIKLSCLGIPTISLWTFLIGGHILGAVISIIAYPVLIRFYKRFIAHPTV